MKESSPLSDKNLHTIGEERRVFRDALKDAGTIPGIHGSAQEGLDELNNVLTDWSIQKEGGLSAAKARLRKEREASERVSANNVDREAIVQSLGGEAEVYEAITARAEHLDDLRDFTMQKMRDVKSEPTAKRAHERLLQSAIAEKERLSGELATLENAHPRVAHAFQLVRYKEGLAKEGHIAPTASVETNIDRIGRNMLVGKSMFLHGPTGTGKTSLARLAAKHFTGQPPEMVYCSPQTRESAIWGKTGIRPTASGAIETVDIFGPLAKAIQEGKVVVFDEFTSLPKEQMVFIKGLMNAKQGDEVNIPGNGQITINHGFQIICTANLKSEKNPEKQELPPEIAREFEQNNIKIDYQPKDEVYDVMLVRLMNPNGSIDASWQTLNETLPKLCEAMGEIQAAYTGILSKDAAKLADVMDASADLLKEHLANV